MSLASAAAEVGSALSMPTADLPDRHSPAATPDLDRWL